MMLHLMVSLRNTKDATGVITVGKKSVRLYRVNYDSKLTLPSNALRDLV